VLNERFGTQFNEEDRLFFQQIKERACNSEQVVRTAMANPIDKFELGIRKLIEDLMIERMAACSLQTALPLSWLARCYLRWACVAEQPMQRLQIP
jgi:hypothetical protein